MVIDLSFYIDVQAPVATALSLAAGAINQAAVSVSAIIYRLVAGAVQGLPMTPSTVPRSPHPLDASNRTGAIGIDNVIIFFPASFR
jgi:hypothetical protein